MVRTISSHFSWLEIFNHLKHPHGHHNRKALRRGMTRCSLILVGIYFLGATIMAGGIVWVSIKLWQDFCHACGATGEVMGGIAAIMEEEETAVL